MDQRRVAVTGVGVVSPLGVGLADFHRALAAGRPGVRTLPPELAQGSGVQVAATIDWDASRHFSAGEAASLDRVAQFSLVAAAEAVAAAGAAFGDPLRAGVYWGTGLGGASTLDASYRQVYGEGQWRARPLTVVMAMSNAAGAAIALRYGLRGPFANFATACSSSAMALGEAARLIATGRVETMVAGGSEALLTPGTLLAWQSLRTLAPADARDPAASCKPFDKHRCGLVLGEGAAAFVLEDEACARRRGARVHALLTGYGNTCDAAHLSRPDRDGQARAMRAALDEAGLEPRAIGYINAHGTATAVGDLVEAQAINAVFGPAAREIPVSSTKSMHGHLLGGAGALELAAALLALERGIVAPTATLADPDPGCALRHVARRAEHMAPPRAVMSNSFAFGGSNVVLVAERAA